MRRRIAVILAAVAMLSACSVTPTTRVRMSANMDAKGEIAEVDSPGTGTCTVWFDKAAGKVSWNIYYTGLTGPLTAVHFHGPAGKGAEAGAQVDLGEAGFDVPIQGSAVLSAEQASQLLAGKWYVNMHTAAYPDGEIRGQILPQP